MMYAKVHEKKDSLGVLRRVLAVCDEQLLGKILQDKKSGAHLDLKAYRGFYEGKKVSENEVIKLCHMTSIDSFNAVGVEAIKALSVALVVELESVKKIGGVPHLQVYKI